MSNIQEIDKECGDFGGRTKKGSPCGRPAGQGTDEETGRCHQHREKDAMVSKDGLEKIQKLASYGLNLQEIADWFGYSESWFKKVKSNNEEIKRRWAMGKAELMEKGAQTLTKKAIHEENTTALIYLMKSQGGRQWNEDDQVRHVHEGDQQQAVQVNIDKDILKDIQNMDGTSYSQARKGLVNSNDEED